MSPLEPAPDYAASSAANERTLMRSLLREIEDALRKLEDIHARYPHFTIEWRDGFCHALGDIETQLRSLTPPPAQALPAPPQLPARPSNGKRRG